MAISFDPNPRWIPQAERSNVYFGATWTRLFVGQDVSSVPISRARCSKSPGASSAEYIAWGSTNVAEAEREEALALLAELVERDHPHHKPAVYGGMSLEELRQRVGSKASPAGFLIGSNFGQSPIRKDKEKTRRFSGE